MVAKFSRMAAMGCATLAVYGSTLEARGRTISRSPGCLALRFLGAIWQSLADGAGLQERSRLQHSSRWPPNARLHLGSNAPGKSHPPAALACVGARPGVLGILCVCVGNHQPFRGGCWFASALARRLLWVILLPTRGC